MRMQITQNNLHRALSLLSRVASNKTPLPILANILLKCTKNSLELSATNLEVAVSHTTKGKVDEEGSVTVPARLLYEFVAQLPKDTTVDLVFDKNKLFISTGSYSSHIQGTGAEDFPALPVIKSNENLDINVDELKRAINQTILAASHDETRPILGGAFFHTVDTSAYVAATDGYRLAEVKLPISSVNNFSGVVPLQTLQDVLRILQDTNQQKVKLQFEDGQFGLVCGETSLVSRLIEGQYPAYQQLIPEKSEISFNINREELLTAAKLAGLFARESGGSITITASESDKTVSVSSLASQVGDNNSELKCEVVGSGKVVLNVRYLTEALNSFDTNTINFRFSGDISPCVITSSEQPNYQHIVMPLKS